MILCLRTKPGFFSYHPRAITIVDHFVTILSTYFPNARKSRVDAKTFVSLGNAVSRHGVSPYMIYRAKLGKGYAEIDYMYTHFPRTTFDSLLLENAKTRGDGEVVGRRAVQKSR